MISRRPTSLKDEPVASFDELQDLLTENMAVMNTLNKTLGNRTDTQAVSPEEIASAAKNAVRELLEQRQRKFEQEEQEAKARGALTPQECYAKLSADYAKVYHRMRYLQVYRGSSQAAGNPQPQNRSQAGCPYC